MKSKTLLAKRVAAWRTMTERMKAVGKEIRDEKTPSSQNSTRRGNDTQSTT